MKEFFQELSKRPFVFIILMGVILLLIGAAGEINIGTFSFKIPDVIGRVIVAIIGLILIGFGAYLVAQSELRGYTQPESQSLPPTQTMPSTEERIDESLLASTLQDLRDRSLPPNITGIVVERSITLQKCPNMREGWKPEEVEFDHDRDKCFELPDYLSDSYKRFLEGSYKKRTGVDQDNTVMLVKKPVAWTDRPKLVLETQLNLYTYSQFYWNIALLDEDLYNRAMTDLFEQGKFSFPHNLCMHLVVVTKDDLTLLTLRSRDVATHPNTWSCSIEENLRSEELEGDPKTTVARWMNRAIFEELGVKSDHCKKLRVLSVFLEGVRRLNVSLTGYALLDLTHEELSKIIKSLPRHDYEFTEHDYLSFEQIAKELKNPTRPYHPTSRYRMLMALLHRYGEANFVRQYMGLLKKL